MEEKVQSNTDLAYVSRLYSQSYRPKHSKTSVYIANTRQDIQVAVKLYWRKALTELNMLSYQREAALIETLSLAHPEHFIKFLGCFTDVNCFYIVTELYSFTLEDLIKNARDKNLIFSEGELYSSIKHMIEGFAFMTNNRVYHRSINPRNIVLNRKGSIKIIDFSDAVLLDEGADEIAQFTIINNKEYLAPEILGYLENAGENVPVSYSLEKNDVFAAGLTFLQLCTLQDPIGLNIPENLLLVSELLSKVPYSFLKDLIASMVDFEPTTRASFSELLSKFTSKPMEYPLGNISPYDLSLAESLKSYPDETHEYSAFYKEEKVIVRFYHSQKKSHIELSNYYVSALSSLSGKFESFLQFFGAYIQESLLYVIHEDFGTSIEDIRARRIINFDSFSEQELAKHFKSLLLGLAISHENKIYHNNIKSSTVYINSCNQAKFNSFSIPFAREENMIRSTQNALRKSVISRDMSFLAPEIVEATSEMVENENAGLVYRKGPADVYSLGLVFYEMASLNLAKEFNFRRKSVELQAQMNILKYPVWVKNLINGMLDYNPKNRLTPRVLLGFIPSEFDDLMEH